MSAVATRSYTVEKYLELDAEVEDERCEFQHGSVIPRAGANPEHNQVKTNVASELGTQLRSDGCWVMTSDQRVRVSFGYVYPDVVVACEPTYEDTRPRTLQNPELIVEVTSDSSQARDHSDKLAAYTELDSLWEYWIIDPENRFSRSTPAMPTDGAIVRTQRCRTSCVVRAFDLEVSLQDVYALVIRDA